MSGRRVKTTVTVGRSATNVVGSTLPMRRRLSSVTVTWLPGTGYYCSSRFNHTIKLFVIFVFLKECAEYYFARFKGSDTDRKLDLYWYGQLVAHQP